MCSSIFKCLKCYILKSETQVNFIIFLYIIIQHLHKYCILPHTYNLHTYILTYLLIHNFFLYFFHINMLKTKWSKCNINSRQSRYTVKSFRSISKTETSAETVQQSTELLMCLCVTQWCYPFSISFRLLYHSCVQYSRNVFQILRSCTHTHSSVHSHTFVCVTQTALYPNWCITAKQLKPLSHNARIPPIRNWHLPFSLRTCHSWNQLLPIIIPPTAPWTERTRAQDPFDMVLMLQ